MMRCLACGIALLLGSFQTVRGGDLTLSLAAEAEAQRPATGPTDDGSRSAITADLGLSYDDGMRIHGATSIRGIADHEAPERNRLFFHEGYADFAAGLLELTAGRQIVRWGRLDGIRPTDVFRRTDLYDPLEDREEPIWAVRAALCAGSGSVEAVYGPAFEENRLSWDERNPWCLFPDSVEIPGAGRRPAEWASGDRHTPAADIRAPEFGLRADLHPGGWDVGLATARSYDRIPSRLVEASAALGADGVARMVVDSYHDPFLLAGGDLARVIGETTVRAEIARTWPIPPGGMRASPYWRAGAGVDRNFPGVVMRRDLSVLGEYTFDQAGVSGSADPSGYRHFYRHAAVVRLRVEPGRFTRCEAVSFTNLENGDWNLRLETSYTPRGGLEILAGVLFVGGPRNGFFGRFAENDRIRLRVRYAWSTRNILERLYSDGES